MKLSKKAKIAILVGVLVVALGTMGIILALRGTTATGDGIYVQSVSSILGYSGMGGMQNRYAGVIEPQETIEVQKDAERKTTEVKVKEGDVVKKGDVLFTYDTDEANMALEQAKLELERIKNAMVGFTNQITELEKERKKAAASEKLEYTLQIQEAQASMKTEEYNAKVKELEIKKLETNTVESEVKAPIAGVIKSLNESGEDKTGMGGDGSAFITIMATGDYRVKGLVNEQNMRSLSTGDMVTIRSRVEDAKIWKGTIGSIDTDKGQSNQDKGYGGGMMMAAGGGEGDNTTQSTKYPFYVTLDSLDGLMMGQHVYIELGSAETEQEGLKLPSMYLVQEEGSNYVWADKNGKLERRPVTLGEYDEVTDSHTVTAGLELSDKLAFPDETLQEGNKTVEEMPMENPGAVGDGAEDGGMEGGEGGGTVNDGGTVGGEDGNATAVPQADGGMNLEKIEEGKAE